MSIDLVDDTFIDCPPEVVAAAVADERRWAQWWPDLTLIVFMDRGVEGIRWSVTQPVTGSCELWLEAMGPGVVIHHYLRLGSSLPGNGSPVRAQRHAARERHRYAVRWKRCVWALKDELEAEPRVLAYQVNRGGCR